MKKLDSDQRGVAHIIIVLLALTVLSGVGLAAYRVGTMQPKTEETPKTKLVSTKSYTDAELGVSFDYPGNWVVSTDENGTRVITSPDYKLDRTSVIGMSLTSGARFEVDIQPKGPNEVLTDYQVGGDAPRYITVDGERAIQSQLSGYEGSYLSITTFFKGDTAYTVVYRYAEVDKSTYTKEHTDFLDSFAVQ